MEVATIDHVNVETDDIERSEQFYREVIGLEKGPRPNFDRPGYWMYAGGQPVVHIMKTAPEKETRHVILKIYNRHNILLIYHYIHHQRHIPSRPQ